jgi:hypothetical protein
MEVEAVEYKRRGMEVGAVESKRRGHGGSTLKKYLGESRKPRCDRRGSFITHI